MIINIKYESDIFEIEIDEESTFEQIREFLYKEHNLDIDHADMFYESKILLDHRTLNDYLILDNDTIDIVEIKKVVLTLKNIMGACINVYTDNTASIKEVKVLAMLEMGDIVYFDLVYNNEVLLTKKRLYEYGINDNKTINLNLKMGTGLLF